MKKYIFDYNTVTNIIDDYLAEFLNFYIISEKENTIKCKMNESTYNTFCSILASNLNFLKLIKYIKLNLIEVHFVL